MGPWPPWARGFGSSANLASCFCLMQPLYLLILLNLAFCFDFGSSANLASCFCLTQPLYLLILLNLAFLSPVTLAFATHVNLAHEPLAWHEHGEGAHDRRSVDGRYSAGAGGLLSSLGGFVILRVSCRIHVS